MAITISHGGKYIALGLRWTLLDHKRSESSAIRRFANSGEFSYFAKIPVATRFVHGFAADEGAFEKTPKAGEYLTLAGLFAAMPDIDSDSILTLSLPNRNTAAFVTLVDGEPLQDRLVAIDKLQSALAETSRETGKDFTVYGNLQHIFPDSRRVTLDDMLGHATPASDMRPVPRSPVPVVIGVGSVLAAVVLGGVIWYQHRGAVDSALHQTAALVDTYSKQTRPATIANPGIARQSAEQQYDAYVGPRELFGAGWVQDKVDCTAALCKASWSTTIATTSDFQKAMPNRHVMAGNDATSPGGSNHALTETFSAPFAAQRLPLESLPRRGTFVPWLETRLRNYRDAGFTASSEKPRVIDLPQGLSEADIPSSLWLGIGEISISGPLGWYEVAVDGLPPNVFIKSVSFSKFGDAGAASFDLKGVYYVKQ